MEIAIIVLASLSSVLSLISAFILFKNIKNRKENQDYLISLGEIKKEIENLEHSLKDSISLSGKDNIIAIGDKLNKQVLDNHERDIQMLNTIQDNLTKQITEINRKVDESIKDGFKTNNEQVEKVIQSLARIDEAKKNLDTLTVDITNLNNTLSFSGPLGKFGEKVLGEILRSVFGDTKGIYDEQYMIAASDNPSSRVIADAVVHLPSPLNLICIDSKFSFGKYSSLLKNSNEENTPALRKELKAALKQQIDKIAKDYIIPNKTTDYALMFIPNDGIYVFLESDDEFYKDVISYAARKKVIVTSPSTLQPILANLNLFRIRIETSKDIDAVLNSIREIKGSLLNYEKSWDVLSKNIDAIVVKKEDFGKKVSTLTKKLDKVINSDNDQSSAAEEEIPQINE
ncbi:MAG: DNA recombination protein RmuC [Bacilli bacterium]